MHGNVKWTNDMLIEIMRKRLEGATLQEIGDEYGCSRENIRQVLGRGMRIMKADCRCAEIIFPNIREYMIDHGISLYKMSHDIGAHYNSMGSWLKYGRDIPLGKARIIADYLGMTIDEAFQLPDPTTGDA